MEIIYQPNFDYEFELAGVHAPKMRRQIIERFEWLVFWGEDENGFCFLKEYDQDYLSYIKSFKNIPSIFSNTKTNKNWWGSLENIDLEKTLNSKLFAAKLAKELLGFPFELLEKGSSSPVKNVVYKIDYSVSGKGISKAFHEKAIFSEPLYQRKYDIGSRYEKKLGQWRLKHRSLSRIDGDFAFRGAKLRTDTSFNLDLSAHDEDQLKILKHLSHYYDLQTLQMDSFLYLKDGEIKAKALCEINYRRTMVDVCYHLLKVIGKDEATFLLRPIKPFNLEVWHQLRELCQDKAILMSPPRTRDFAIMILDEERKQDLLLILGNKLAIEF